MEFVDQSAFRQYYVYDAHRSRLRAARVHRLRRELRPRRLRRSPIA